MRPSVAVTTLVSLLLGGSRLAGAHPGASPVSKKFESPGRTDASDAFASLLSQASHELRANFKPGEASKWSRCTPNTCTIEAAGVRKDWETLDAPEKKNFIDAVQCLFRSPSISPPGFAAAAKGRYDDFVAIHSNLTLQIHGTYNFLAWHRYFIASFEAALRQECGFTGNLPYWNWFTYTSAVTQSPVFDGSDTSLSGDGSYFKHNGSLGGGGTIWLPSANGGGCVTSGPFVHTQLNVGPIRSGMDGLNNSAGLQDDNPRCLQRDLSTAVLSKWMTKDNLLNITIGAASGSVLDFQDELQGRFSDGFLGMHATGHYAMGGDAADLFTSVNDPAFWLHHAMLDSLWWIWQVLHPDQADTIAGVTDLIPNASTRNGTLDDVQSVGVNAPPIKIKWLLDTMGGNPFCYYYV